MRRGKITHLYKARHIGFIKDSNGQRIRFQIIANGISLKINDQVSYRTCMTKIGLLAVDIELVDTLDQSGNDSHPKIKAN
ncbi:hypothetical protein [Pedobacter mucosus]|uniref:hypothetical protein n=1 Tax=Pedobacter mucosus TaxID=2895286 RepID=UPI001EE4392C|nr:hypothetical protein [Pedobacter mucosus]UKT64264.1 hypothetical protein LOK61_00465 [Pedobacter mucosus]